MSFKFNVEVFDFKKINKIENRWDMGDYTALLKSMGLEDDDL